jgi:DNA-binding response OmpR family regulator
VTTRRKRHGGKSASVLIVENDRDSLDALETLLQLDEIEVTAAESAQRALALLLDGARPGVILLDVWTPRMSAFEFFRARSRAPAPVADIPVIAISGDTQALDELGGWPAATFRKPFKVDELIERVRRLLEAP